MVSQTPISTPHSAPVLAPLPHRVTQPQSSLFNTPGCGWHFRFSSAGFIPGIPTWTISWTSVWNLLPRQLSRKESTCQHRRCKRCRFYFWVGKILWRRKCQPTPVFLPENPMDRGAWQATVHRVAQSWTRLK